MDQLAHEKLDKLIEYFSRPYPQKYAFLVESKDVLHELVRPLVKRQSQNPERVEPNPTETKTPGLAGVRFSYAGTESAENIQFYNRFIRGFLRWHRTQSAWIKGALVKREAYLVVKEYLAEKAIKMLSSALKHGGKFAIKTVNPFLVIQEAKELNRQTKGYLHYGDIELGDYDEMFCPPENYQQVSVREYCIGTEDLQKPCTHWSRWRCIYPRKNPSPDPQKVETTWCPDKRKKVPATNCVECRKSDPARWQACQEFKQEEPNLGL